MLFNASLIVLALGLSAGGAPPASIPPILLTPLPRTGAVPSMAPPADGLSLEELQARAKLRNYAGQIRALARRCFGARRPTALREKGLAELREFTDPAAFIPMFEELADQDSAIRAAVLDHFASQGDAGQAALSYVAIHADDKALRADAIVRIISPTPPAVLRVIDAGLRDRNHAVANASATLAASLDALSAIPLLIFAQATEDRVENKGDLAWIAIGTSKSYVANLVPVVGGNAGAFQPVIGIVYEGTLLRVIDAVAVNYRIDVHNSLVAMTSNDWGQSTAGLGYDMPAWYAWFNEVYVPYKQEQQRVIELAQQAAGSEQS
ncbi:MAG: hypothetical protein KDA22_03090 [Phycisphaerales bacterium]|nr:hypothetical protein [Phycisphaerales bacterium]